MRVTGYAWVGHNTIHTQIKDPPRCVTDSINKIKARLYAKLNKNHKCENACMTDCEFINRYFLCDCYQCLKTTLQINYCINCGCTDPRKI